MTVTLVMLLHAVLPHHHHEEEVCFSESHCEGVAVIIDHECMDDAAHEHDGPQEEKECNVTQAYLIPDLNRSSGNSDISKIFRKNVFFQLVSDNMPGEASITISIFEFRHVPDIISRIAGKSLSLRGPPTLV